VPPPPLGVPTLGDTVGRLLYDSSNMSTGIELGSPAWLEGVTRLVSSAGDKLFEERLLGVLNLVLPVDHCVVFTYSPEGKAGHLFTHGQMPTEEADALASDYVERYHRQDPNYAQIMQEHKLADGDSMAPLKLSGRYDASYRNHFFDRHNLIDKASTVGRVEYGSVYCNFYRMGSSGPFSDGDWAKLELILPLLTSLIAVHYRLILGHAASSNGEMAGTPRSVVHTVISKKIAPFDRLTERERDVCERILLGYTSIGIGLDLNIAPSSVVTYRRRSYEKLGIATQNELFALCLGASRTLPR
jgi:DNA-binding CsgD family transcriptional regulator